MKTIDLIILLSVPLLLIGVFTLPRSVNLELVLAYRSPTLLTAFSSHFVHLRGDHLLANLAAYGLVVPLVYVLSLLSDHRMTFLATFVTFVISFPFALSVLNLRFPRPRIGYGFSGIVMAFVGFLALILWDYLVFQFHDETDSDRSPVLFFVGGGIIAMWSIPPSRTRLAIIGLSILGSVIYLWPLDTESVGSVIELVRWFARHPGYFDSAVWAILIITTFPLAAFPPSPVDGRTILNVYSHGLGYCLGFLVPYITLRVVGVSLK